ncbi:MAG: TetR/AcrR family transcriptional regulator [Pseudomonadota bacterium]
MPRKKGAANRNSADRKREILDRIWAVMRSGAGKPLSWREMAAAAGVGPATLSHHFGKRDDVVSAVFEAKREDGADPLRILAEPSSRDLEESLNAALRHMIIGLTEYDVGDLVALGLAEGMYHEAIGPLFVRDGLEPILAGVEARLRAHEERGDFPAGKNLRYAAIILASPVLLTYAHQQPLGGRASYPTALEDLAAQSAKTAAQYLGV